MITSGVTITNSGILPCPTPIPRLIIDYPWGITGLPIVHGGNGAPDSPLDSLFSVTSLAIPQDNGELPDPPQRSNPKKGRSVGWLACIAQRISKATTRKLNGL